MPYLLQKLIERLDIFSTPPTIILDGKPKISSKLS